MDGPVCCTDDCCGPGSYCCARANPHLHDDDGNWVDIEFGGADV